MSQFRTASSKISGFASALAVLLFVASALTGQANGVVINIPQSALIPSTTYYTDLIGGGIGSALIMTGGGNAANVGFSRNDDGFSGPIALGFTLSFFGTDYTSFYANNNGNISFTGGLSAFTPTGPQGASVPVISPFFADVDTRDLASGLMSLRNDIPNQTIMTWDQVGYYSANADLLNSFQLVVRGPGYSVPAGEGTIGFFYRTMQWETGDASGGSGGFGGTPGAVGFGDGASNGIVLAGSIENGISGVVNNHHIWFYENLTPVEPPGNGTAIPEPGTLLLLGLGVPMVARLRRKA